MLAPTCQHVLSRCATLLPLSAAAWPACLCNQKQRPQRATGRPTPPLPLLQVLSAKERGAPAALACWGALAAAASEDQVAGTLLPTAVRMLKRNPEPALAAAAPMLAAVRCACMLHVGLCACTFYAEAEP